MLAAYVKTDIGLVRKTNEDSYAFFPPHLFVVADGMGGHVAGEIASSQAVKIIGNYVAEHGGKQDAQIMLEQAIQQANSEIFAMAQQHAEYTGMGTTVSAVYIDGSTVYWAHVGDSRIYHITSDGMFQITNDHSLVWELVKSGNITADEALHHPHRNLLTRAVGTSNYIAVDTGSFTWEQNNKLVLCTDGLTNMVSEAEIAATLTNSDVSPEAQLDYLVNKAKDAGGLDNITVVLLSCGEI